jgi:hypothetical protein
MINKVKLKGQQRFNDIEKEYRDTFFLCNNRSVNELYYSKGFVYLSIDNTSACRYRICEFEKMLVNLKQRLNEN